MHYSLPATTAAALSLFLLTAIACTSGPRSVGADEATLVELQQVLARAWVAGDRQTIEEIISPDWTSTGPDGRTAGRATVFADVFETRVHRIVRLEVDDVRARVFGNAAVVTGRTHGVGEYAGAAYDVVIRFTDTFIHRDGRWQAMASHASLVPR